MLRTKEGKKLKEFFEIIGAKEFWHTLARSAGLKLVTDILAVMSGVLGAVCAFCALMCLYKFKRKDTVCLKYQDAVYKLSPVMFAVSGAFILAWTVIAFG